MNLERLNSPAIVYAWSDHLTGKVYCGSHKGSDNDGYICSSKYMLKEYKERPQDFTRQIIAKGAWKDCIALEKKINEQLIKSIETTYNKQAFPAIVNEVHPMLGKKHTEESLKKISLTGKGRKLSEEHKKKLHSGNIGNKHTLGYKHTAESILKISEASKARKHSEETKKKIGDSNRGKKASPETIIKLKESHLGKIPGNKGKPSPLKGKKQSSEFIAKRTAAIKAVFERKKAKNA